MKETLSMTETLPMTETFRTHGLLITFRRPADLADHLDALSNQTQPLSTLLVVDNDDDPAIRAIVDDHPSAAGQIRYLGVTGNPGPAGGIAIGIDEVVREHLDHEWLVLLDDDDPPTRPTTLEELATITAELDSTQRAVGGVGLWGARLQQNGRLRAVTATTPEPVAYLSGNACAHYRIGALRAAGGPDPKLFFGFDDLDLGLAIDRANFSLWSSGLAREHGRESMVENRTVRAEVTEVSWRRYYSLRNLVIILRRNQRHKGAVLMLSLIHI